MHPAAGRPAGRLLVRKFYDLHPSNLQTPHTGTFPKQLDGAGVTRGMTTAYWFMYNQTAGHLVFRNMLCACTQCTAGSYKECVNKVHVCPSVEAQFMCLTMEPESDDEPNDDDDADSTATGDMSDMGEDAEELDYDTGSVCHGLYIDLAEDLHLFE